MRTAGIENERGPFLDLARALAQAGPASAPAAAIRRPGLSLGLALSLALHLAPLLILLLLSWRSAPIEAPQPIPVQLVIEQKPPPPPPAARTETVAKPPRGRLASEEVGEKAREPDDAADPTTRDARREAPPEQQSKPEQEPQRQPQPELKQAANFIQPQQEPTLLGREALALPAPEIEPLPQKAVAPASSRQAAPGPTPRHPAPQRAVAVIGPPAARDEYLAYLVTLVRPYLRLLTPDIVNGRRGTTSLMIRVLGDGTIARIAVSQSSGYPDIDARVMQIVSAVGRFPPLPPWIDQPSWDINFHLRFPLPAEIAGRP
ncbi:MAG: TonB family protein [Alphaproteobacteria bacterium]